MKVVKYILGILFIFTSLGAIAQEAFLAFLFLMILGVLLLPPISDWLREKFKLWRNKVIRYGSYFVILILSVVFIPNNLKTSKDSDQYFKTIDFRSKKKVVIKYIKENTKTDQSLQNIENLGKIGKLFNNYNFSIEHPHDGYILDSLESKNIVVFYPRYDFEKAEQYLKKDSKDGFIKDYRIDFKVDNNGKIIYTKTLITFSKSGIIEYENNNVPRFSTFINESAVNSRKEINKLEEQAIEKIENHNETKLKFEKDCLSSWDGSHREVVKYVRERMHNPKSFEHVDTRYGITDGYAGLVMTYRGTNKFGATVTNTVKAKVNLEHCTLISVEE